MIFRQNVQTKCNFSLSLVEFPSLPATSLSGQSYTTVQNYTAEDEDELSIPKGVRVEVTEKSLTGWWKVK